MARSKPSAQADDGADLPRIDPESARLYAVIARKARRAVVFRRGPTRKTRLLLWNLEYDTLVPGQWFFGRIYERRCDLTPDGKLLAYFAAKHRKPYYSWTAISRPPYLTALAFWPKGDTWGGGGLFQNARTFQMNHRPDQFTQGPADDVTFQNAVSITSLGAHAGHGEDEPILSQRLERDGWSTTPTKERKEQPRGSRIWLIYDPPKLRTLPLTRQKTKFTLRLLTHGYHEQNGRTYVETADVLDARGQMIRDFGRVDWIDADHNGDVLLARDGKLERLPSKNIESSAAPRVVADLNTMHFENIPAPDWALNWRRKSPF